MALYRGSVLLYHRLTAPLRRSIRARALCITLILALLPLSALGIYSRLVAREAVLRVQVQSIRAHAEDLARAIDRYLTDRGSDVTLMARHPLIRSFSAASIGARPALRSQVLPDLANFLANRSYYQAAYLLDSHGQVLLSTVENPDPQAASRPYFLRALAGETYISEPSLPGSEPAPERVNPGSGTGLGNPGRAVIYCSAPVPHPEGKGIAGVAILRARAEDLWEIVEQERDQLGKGSLAILFDEYGIRLAHARNREWVFWAVAPLPREVERRLLAGGRFGDLDRIELLPLPDLARGLREAARRPYFTHYLGIGPERYHTVAVPLRSRRWMVVESVPESAFLAPVRAFTRNALWLGAGMALLAFIVSWIGSRSIVNPLVRLIGAARHIGEGDLSIPISLGKEDELGQLAQTLEQMRARLADSFRELVTAYEREKGLKGQLQLLYDSALAISANLSLGVVLQQIVDRARELCGARYAALGVVDAGGRMKEFITSGITQEQRAAIGPLPQGRGLLEAMLQGGEVLSLRDIRQDPRSVGFPPGHPPMTSFLGAAVTSRGRILGALYLTDKVGAEEFSPDDRELIARFSAHAAITLENATLYGQVEERARELSQQLMVQSQYASTVLRSIADGVYSTDPERRILSWSRGAEVITGFKEEEALGSPCQDFLRHCDQAGRVLCDTKCPISRALQQGRPVFVPEVWVHTRDGGRVPISAAVAPIFDAEGRVAGAVEVFHDISREREMWERIEQANRAKSEFLANMSHELRTPLTAIIGFSELLHEGLVGEISPQQAECVGDILTSSRHLLSLINDILDLSKVEAGEMGLQPAELSLSALLQDSLTLVRQRALKNRIAISLEVEEEADALVADERKVKQVLFNLLSNAVKFTPPGGRVGVEARRQGDWVAVTVWDTGIGIAPQDQERLFQPFQQIDRSLARQYQGTGLGLALTRKLVELHGGEIWVESTPGAGSRFTFTLPRQAEEPLENEAPLLADSPAPADEGGLLPYAFFCRHLERMLNLAGRQGRELALIHLRPEGAEGSRDFPGAAIRVIRDQIRPYDVRGKSEEGSALFLLCPDTSLPRAQQVAGRCRALLEEGGIRAEVKIVAYPEDGKTTEELIRALIEYNG